MSETEWLAWAIDPELMLRHLPTIGAVSDRKLRLFAVACCRHAILVSQIRPLTEPFVDAAERFADGAMTLTELGTVQCRAVQPTEESRTKSTLHHACWNAAETQMDVGAADAAAMNSAWGATQAGTMMPDDGGLSAARLVAEQAAQCALLRDIFGNPFRPVAFDPAWRTETAVALARQMYDSREFSAMPILADALQDAGCDNPAILDHCRDANQPHVRGCWVCDLVLGKE